MSTTDGSVSVLLDALRWIADHETDEAAISEKGDRCLHAFHLTRRAASDGARCPDCFSRWWATDGSGVPEEGSYTLGAVAAKALADYEAAS